SVMFRRELLEKCGPYSTRTDIFEDHELWSRMARHTALANIPEELIRYRSVATGLSHTTSDAAQRIVRQRMSNWKAVFPAITDRELDLAAHMGMRHSRLDLKEFHKIKAMLRTLVERWSSSDTDHRKLRDHAHALLMGFHVIGHASILHRALDHSIKRIAALSL
ncbi:MAG: hypothetical protein M3R08_05505, partial [Bacteroidota bacterium]|nr:hypothetical protein [Bacteroidota bacterium]